MEEPLRHRPGFNPWQYKYLRRCAELKDMTRWNRWREKNPNIEIRLEGADFVTGFQEGAYFKGADLRNAYLLNAILQNTYFMCANLQNAYLYNAKLQYSNFGEADLQNADFNKADIQQADITHARLQNTILSDANLENVVLWDTDLTNAELWNANLQKARLRSARITNTTFKYSDLRDANFEQCVVDGFTSIWKCKVDRHTDFRGVALDACRIDPATKALLKCNIRRLNWEKWYKKKKCLIKLPVFCFWWISDYGKSPTRLIGTFFGISFLFALFYWFCGTFIEPGIVANVYNHAYFPDNLIFTFFKTWFFSIVTMVSLGGYAYLTPITGFGHFLVSLQLIFGYFILGALVTYLGILYTSDGPAGEYADEISYRRWIQYIYRKTRHWFWSKKRHLFG